MRALATWCVQHRRTVLFSWLAALILISILGIAAGSTYSNTFSLPKTQSTDALHLLEAVSPKVSGDVEQVVFESSHGEKITSPAIETRINGCLQRFRRSITSRPSCRLCRARARRRSTKARRSPSRA